MKPITSEVFENYVKIAEEIGLVETPKPVPAKPKESPALRRYKKSPHPRVGSDDISTIEALYNIKPDSSIPYEHCIMEAAHPKSIVIAPSYDKLNGLVENNIERQNIMSNIALKPNDGNATNHRYAEKELLMELIRIANDMDNRGNEELRVLADACIDKLALKKNSAWYDDALDWVKQKGKDVFNAGEGALAGGSVGGILGGIVGALGGPVGIVGGAAIGAGIGALVAALGKTAPQVVDIQTNAKDTISQLDDLKKNFSPNNDEYSFLDKFDTALTQLASIAQSYNTMISQMQSDPHISHGMDQASKIMTGFLEQVNIVNQMSNLFDNKVNRGVYNQFVQHSKALTPFTSMISNDIEDVQQSLESLQVAIKNFQKSIGQVQSTVQSMPASSPSASVPNSTQSNDYSGLLENLGITPSKEEEAFFSDLGKQNSIGH